MTGIVRYIDGHCRYFDNDGDELFKDDIVLLNGEEKILYETVNGELGTDATNPVWIEIGRAVPCEYGIYPLDEEDMKNIKRGE